MTIRELAAKRKQYRKVMVRQRRVRNGLAELVYEVQRALPVLSRPRTLPYSLYWYGVDVMTGNEEK